MDSEVRTEGGGVLATWMVTTPLWLARKFGCGAKTSLYLVVSAGRDTLKAATPCAPVRAESTTVNVVVAVRLSSSTVLWRSGTWCDRSWPRITSKPSLGCLTRRIDSEVGSFRGWCVAAPAALLVTAAPARAIAVAAVAAPARVSRDTRDAIIRSPVVWPHP